MSIYTRVNNIFNTNKYIYTQVNNILSDFRLTFEKSGSIPLNKFSKYADSIYQNMQDESTRNLLAETLYKTTRKDFDIDVIKEKLINTFVTPGKDIVINNISILLQRCRYIIYLAQYLYVYKNGSTGMFTIDAITGDYKYFNIYSNMVIDFILDMSSAFIDTPKYQSTNTIEHYILNSSIIQNINSQIKYFTGNTQKLEKQLVISHGSQLSAISKVPDNIILVMITPYNRISTKTAVPHLITDLQYVLQGSMVNLFITTPTCFIDKKLKTTMDFNNKCLFNAVQIYYPNQSFMDIELSYNKKDFDDMAAGIYNFNNKTNKFDARNKTQDNLDKILLSDYLITSSAAANARHDIPKIVVQYSCRVANNELKPYFVELSYRYNKIHNVFVDSSGKCLLKPNTLTDSANTCDNYNTFFSKLANTIPGENAKPNNVYRAIKPYLFMNNKLSPIRGTRSQKSKNYDYIITHAYDDKIDAIFNDYMRNYSFNNIISLLSYITVDYGVKVLSMIDKIIINSRLNKLFPNSKLFIALAMIYELIDKHAKLNKLITLNKFMSTEFTMLLTKVEFDNIQSNQVIFNKTVELITNLINLCLYKLKLPDINYAMYIKYILGHIVTNFDMYIDYLKINPIELIQNALLSSNSPVYTNDKLLLPHNIQLLINVSYSDYYTHHIDLLTTLYNKYMQPENAGNSLNIKIKQVNDYYIHNKQQTILPLITIFYNSCERITKLHEFTNIFTYLMHILIYDIGKYKTHILIAQNMHPIFNILHLLISKWSILSIEGRLICSLEFHNLLKTYITNNLILQCIGDSNVFIILSNFYADGVARSVIDEIIKNNPDRNDILYLQQYILSMYPQRVPYNEVLCNKIRQHRDNYSRFASVYLPELKLVQLPAIIPATYTGSNIPNNGTGPGPAKKTKFKNRS